METEKNLELLKGSDPLELKVSRSLPCELTLDEQRERGLQLANIASDISLLELQLKHVTSEFKTKIQDKENQFGTVQSAVQTRREYRDVTCTEFVSIRQNVVYIVRDDLGTIVDNRPISQKERQRMLPTQPKADAKTDAKAEGNGKTADGKALTPIQEDVAKKRGKAARA